jgi:hypothetical protein
MVDIMAQTPQAGAGEHVQIHPSFWASHTFDMLSDDLTPYARLGTMITKADGDRTWAYTDLEIEPAGVMKTWPKMGPLARGRLRFRHRSVQSRRGTAQRA